MRQSVYPRVRDLMEVGDVICFGGRGPVSATIKRFTGAPVSHVGVILRTQVLVEGAPAGVGIGGHLVQVIESTSLDGFVGVVTSRLSDRLERYFGEVWWLPLSGATRQRLNIALFVSWLLKQEGRRYDTAGAVLAGLDDLDAVGLTRAHEDLSRLFCSELVAAALREAGALPRGLNVSEITPIDLVRFSLYGEAVQLLGDVGDIRGFNSVDPESWVTEAAA